MRKIAVIGNGPSASGRGFEIDQCDFVVRMHSYLQYGSVDIGTKLDALAGAFKEDIVIPDEKLSDDFEIWVNVCKKDVRLIPTDSDAADLLGIIKLANWRPIRFLKERSLEAALQSIGGVTTFDHTPRISCGLAVICMALDYPVFFDEIHLFGFSALSGGSKENPFYANGGIVEKDNMSDVLAHDWVAEKILIKRFVDDQEWCGVPQKCRCVWHDAVNVPNQNKETK